MAVLPPLQNFSDHIRAATRRHDFFAGRQKGRAHRRRIFPTSTAAVALFEIADERTVFERKSQPRREWQFDWSREIFSQTRVDSKGVVPENFARIHPVARIENAFDLAHRVKQPVPQLFAHVFSACDTDTMFG